MFCALVFRRIISGNFVVVLSHFVLSVGLSLSLSFCVCESECATPYTLCCASSAKRNRPESSLTSTLPSCTLATGKLRNYQFIYKHTVRSYTFENYAGSLSYHLTWLSPKKLKCHLKLLRSFTTKYDHFDLVHA